MISNILILGLLTVITLLPLDVIFSFDIGNPWLLALIAYMLLGIIFLLVHTYRKSKSLAPKQEIVYTQKFIFISLLAVIIACIVAIGFLFTKTGEQNIYLRLYGRIAFLFVTLALCVTPLMIYIKNMALKVNLPLMRKIFGIMGLVFFIKHLLSYLTLELAFHSAGGFFSQVASLMQNMFTRSDAFSGLIAGIVLLILWITSNMFSMKFLGGKTWLKIQSLAYPLFILAAIHVSFASRFDPFYIILTVLLIGVRTIAYLTRNP